MPRTKAVAVVPDKPTGPNSVVASAARVSGKRNMPRSNTAQEWQTEAWTMFDQVGELAASAQWIGNALSRVTLGVKQNTPGGRVDITTGEPVVTLDALFDGPTGQSQMMGSLGVHFTIPGEGWLVGVPMNPDAGRLRDWWRVLSNQEVKRVGSRWEIDRGDGNVERYKATTDDHGPAEAFVLRIWRSHPAKWVEANSPVRAALPILRELVGLTQHVAANIDSRLAGAGILAVPSEMTFSSPSSDEEPAGDGETDEFLAELITAMTTPIGDRGNASAVVPMIIKAPGAILGNIQHIKFTSDLDAEARELRNEAIRRLALALDIPPEVLLGVSDVNHWNAWLITEEAIKLHVEPLVELITSALTTEYLWPALVDAGVADPSSYVIEGDTSALRQRPSHSTEASELHRDLLITDAARLREQGFDDSDALDPASEEYRRRLLMNVASGVTTADLTAAALAALGVTIQPKPSEVDAETETDATVLPGPGSPPTPAIEAPREPPAMVAGGNPVQAITLLVGAEQCCLRALERANNRLNNRSKAAKIGPVPEGDLAAALTGAWTHIERVAALSGVDTGELTTACDRYVRDRLTAGQQHDPHTLLAHLTPLIPGTTDAA